MADPSALLPVMTCILLRAESKDSQHSFFASLVMTRVLLVAAQLFLTLLPS